MYMVMYIYLMITSKVHQSMMSHLLLLPLSCDFLCVTMTTYVHPTCVATYAWLLLIKNLLVFHGLCIIL